MSTQEPVHDDRNVEAIASRYRSAIMAFFMRRVKNRSDAEDLTQDVFAKLTRRAHLDTIGNVERYVFQAAANLLRDRARRAGARPRIESEGYADPEGRLVDELSPERHLVGREIYRRFLEALEMLPERPRMIFILNRFEEMSAREIAAVLGVSQRLVELDISRVLVHLREQLP